MLPVVSLNAAGMCVAIVWRPLIPIGWIGTLLLVCLIAASYAYLRAPGNWGWAKLGLLWLRLLTLSLFAAILLGPSREIAPEQATNQGRLLVMVDASQSMEVEDMAGQSRLQFVASRWLGPGPLAAMLDQTQVELYRFAERANRIYGQGDRLSALESMPGQSTYLVRSLTEVVQTLPYLKRNQRVLVLSDGIDSEDAGLDRLVAAAKSRNVSISTVALGSVVGSCDVGLVAVAQQESLYPNELGGLMARIFHSGAEGRQTTLRVQAGEDVQELPLQLSDERVFEIPILIRQAEPGTYAYQLSLEPLGEETELGNNSTTVFVPVKPRRIRVLLLEGQPFWDTKFIAETLRKDDRLELVQISQIGPGKLETIVTRASAAEGVAVPQSVEAWSAYDVVILGKQIQHLLDGPAAAALAQHVQEGGGHVVFARGQAVDESWPEGRQVAAHLSELEPVTWLNDTVTVDRLQATIAGRVTPWLSGEAMGTDFGRAVEALRPWSHVEIVQTVKGSASELVQAESEGRWWPAVIVGPAGEGSAVVVAGEGLWRWSLFPPTSPELAGFYDSFWSNLVRALALGSQFEPGQQVALQLSESSVRLGDELTIDVAAKHDIPAGPPLALTMVSADGQEMDLPLQKLPGRVPRYQAKWTPIDAGIYEVRLSSPGYQPTELSKNFTVYSMNLELLDTAYRPEFLRQLADRTGGQFYRADGHDQFIADLRQDLLTQYLPPRTEYFWDQTWIMLLILGLVGAEWLLRRQVNLI